MKTILAALNKFTDKIFSYKPKKIKTKQTKEIKPTLIEKNNDFHEKVKP